MCVLRVCLELWLSLSSRVLRVVYHLLSLPSLTLLLVLNPLPALHRWSASITTPTKIRSMWILAAEEDSLALLGSGVNIILGTIQWLRGDVVSRLTSIETEIVPERKTMEVI